MAVPLAVFSQGRPAVEPAAGTQTAAGSLVLRPRVFFVALGAVLRARPCKMAVPLAGLNMAGLR